MSNVKRACIEYTGDKYYKQPDGYYRASRIKGGKRLHIQMYQDYWNCIIPKGFVVHHKDDDKENNMVENYFLLTNAGHTRWHKKGNQYALGNQNMLGKKHSEETKEKLRIANIGTEHSEETKEKMRIAQLGKQRIGKYGAFMIKAI